MLKEEVHSQKLADAAVGLGTDNGRVQQSQHDLSNEAMEDA